MKVRLTKGTKLKLPPADVLVMKFNADGDDIEESPDGKDGLTGV